MAYSDIVIHTYSVGSGLFMSSKFGIQYFLGFSEYFLVYEDFVDILMGVITK